MLLLIRSRASPPAKKRKAKIDPYLIAQRIVHVVSLPGFIIIGYFLFDGDWDAIMDFAAHNAHLIVIIAGVLFWVMRTVLNNN
tara:strand:- start:5475 stop:5723 length:249 start_codon:yes stop_codon:yes gene_type:complete